MPGRPRSPRSPLGPTVPLQREQMQKNGIWSIGGGTGSGPLRETGDQGDASSDDSGGPFSSDPDQL
ncbi:hypothetical protein INR49_019980 [Caranx melampygus]|nr:hypothetical protein INR49_019980 [Caranx melampygus]